MLEAWASAADWRSQRVQAWLAWLNVPLEYRDAEVLTDFAYGIGLEVSQRASCALYAGVPGAGKTFAMTRHLVAFVGVNAVRPAEAQWISATDLIEKVAECRKFRSLGDWEQVFRERPVLAIDDIGSEYATAYGASILSTLIEARKREGRVTLATTNLSAQGLRDYDGRLASRLLSNVTMLEDTDWRQRRA